MPLFIDFCRCFVGCFSAPKSCIHTPSFLSGSHVVVVNSVAPDWKFALVKCPSNEAVQPPGYDWFIFFFPGLLGIWAEEFKSISTCLGSGGYIPMKMKGVFG